MGWVRILYILQLNLRCHRRRKERHNHTKQRIDAHRNASSIKIMPKIAALFKATTPDKVTKAEVIFSTFIAEHNIPFAAADHFTSLCQRMFPDSEISKKYACCLTKLTHIINSAVTPHFDAKVTATCKAELDWREFV